MRRSGRPAAVMVADILKRIKEPTRTRAFSVLFAGKPLEEVVQLLESVLSTATGEARNIEVECCEQPAEVVEAVHRGRFDLAFLCLDQILGSKPAEDRNEREMAERLLVECGTFNGDAGLVAISYLGKVCTIPVVVLTSIWEDAAAEEAKQAGAAAVFQAPPEMESFVEELSQILRLNESKRRTRGARIVVIDDEPESLESIARQVRQWRRNSRLLLFQDGEAGWKQLSAEAPDLLIVNMNCPGMSGWKMLPLLAQRNVKYPILAISEDGRPSMLQTCAGSKLDVTFLQRLGAGWEEDVARYLSKEMGASGRTGGEMTRQKRAGSELLSAGGGQKAKGSSEIAL